MKIGLTGGIASGKSTVANWLVQRGAYLVDADQIAREVVQPGSPALLQIVHHFGKDMLHSDGSLNRAMLGSIVFHDAAEKKVLESILHPVIRQTMRERMAQAAMQEPERLIVADIPLLFESKLEAMFDEVWLVYVPEAIQLERLMARNQLSKEEALSRIKSQMPIEDKKALADEVIDNSAQFAETEKALAQLCRRKGLL